MEEENGKAIWPSLWPSIFLAHQRAAGLARFLVLLCPARSGSRPPLLAHARSSWPTQLTRRAQLLGPAVRRPAHARTAKQPSKPRPSQASSRMPLPTLGGSSHSQPPPPPHEGRTA